MNGYLGIDVGGMSIKCGIVTDDGKILLKNSKKIKNGNAIDCLLSVTDEIVSASKRDNITVISCGIGLPCVFDKDSGVVTYGNNLNFNGANLKNIFQERYGLNLSIANDAAAAAYGEYKFGAGVGYENSVLITIGTGVGCGIILGGEPIKSNSSAVGELGHTVIVKNGRKCTCGKCGCLEAYASMTALYKDLKREMAKNQDSVLWKVIDLNNIDGKVFFEYVDTDETAKKVYERFIEYLGIGIVNVGNLLRPDIIVIGGAVSAQGEKLIKPLNDYLSKNLFSKEYTKPISVVAAKNGNDAGIFGAAALAQKLIQKYE